MNTAPTFSLKKRRDWFIHAANNPCKVYLENLGFKTKMIHGMPVEPLFGFYQVPREILLQLFREESEKRALKESRGFIIYREFYVYTRETVGGELRHAFTCSSGLLRRNSEALSAPKKKKELSLIAFPASPRVQAIKKTEEKSKRKDKNPQDNFLYNIVLKQNSTKQKLASELRNHHLQDLVSELNLGEDSFVEILIPAEVAMAMINRIQRNEAVLNFQIYKREDLESEFELYYSSLRVVKNREMDGEIIPFHK